MTAAWFCPSCQKYHAPHVETCPADTELVVGPKPPFFDHNPKPYWPMPGSTADVPFKWDPNQSGSRTIASGPCDPNIVWVMNQ